MMLESVFHTDEQNHEHVPMTSPGMPYVCIHTEFDRFPEKQISWHWHTSVELVYVLEGCVEVKTPEEKVRLQRGMAVFVNTGVLHSYSALGEEPCSVHAHLFHMSFLSGAEGSVFEEKYFAPLCRDGIPSLWPIYPDSYGRVSFIRYLLEAAHLMETEPAGYEFSVREALCHAWLFLLEDTKEVRQKVIPRNVYDSDRLKVMMDFIEAHYQEEISVADIAAASGISTRECTRCFGRGIGTSPAAYLTDYRVRMAAKLLTETEKTVTEVSLSCGFSSPGYFAKIFRELLGSSPKA